MGKTKIACIFTGYEIFITEKMLVFHRYLYNKIISCNRLPIPHTFSGVFCSSEKSRSQGRGPLKRVWKCFIFVNVAEFSFYSFNSNWKITCAHVFAKITSARIPSSILSILNRKWTNFTRHYCNITDWHQLMKQWFCSFRDTSQEIPLRFKANC